MNAIRQADRSAILGDFSVGVVVDVADELDPLLLQVVRV